MKRFLPFILIILIAAGAGAEGVLVFRHQKAILTAREKAQAQEASAGKPGAKPPHIRGGVDAPVTIEEFGDFQCPPCGNLTPILAKIEAEFGPRLRLIFRQYPLEMHSHAAQAARVAEAAGMQGKFWEMYDQLYAHQISWAQMPDATSTFKEYAEKIGLDPSRFAKDVESEAAKERIAADRARANSLGVESTPTLFLNNTRVPQTSVNEQGLRKAIEAALNGKSEPVTALPLK